MAGQQELLCECIMIMHSRGETPKQSRSCWLAQQCRLLQHKMLTAAGSDFALPSDLVTTARSLKQCDKRNIVEQWHVPTQTEAMILLKHSMRSMHVRRPMQLRSEICTSEHECHDQLVVPPRPRFTSRAGDRSPPNRMMVPTAKA